jgi:hypothetical protein
VKPKPIRRRVVIGRPIFNIPEEGYVTPRLKTPEVSTEAIGFVQDFDCPVFD